MINLNKEVEEYVSLNWGNYQNELSQISEMLTLGEISKKDFIAGHNSKATEAKVIQAQIDVLKEIRSKMSMFEISNMENTLDNLYYKEQELEQQLKKLENETNN